MSRIDEALARAKNLDSAVPPVTPPATPADGAPDFPLEAEEERPGEAAAAPVTAVDLPREDQRADAESEGASPAAGVIEIDGDLSHLPDVEKLTFGAQDSTSVEQYRRLAARLLLAHAEKGTRLVMVTSAMPGEGKTLTSSNLALTLSESFKRKVLLIDGDLRRPSIHQVFNIPNVTGLNDGASVDSERRVPLLSYTDNLTILTAGRPDGDPMSVLSGEQMRKVLAEAARRFDFVIIDTPPVALLPDAHLLSKITDMVLLVVESGRSPLPALKRAIEAVGRERILGVVLNRAERGLTVGTYRYYSDYQPYSADRRVLAK